MAGAHRDWDSNKYVLPCFVSILLLLISWIMGLRRTYKKKQETWWSLAQAVRVNDTRHIPIIATYNTYHSPIKNKREKSQTHIPRDVVLYKKATIRYCKKRCKPMGGRVVYIPFLVEEENQKIWIRAHVGYLCSSSWKVFTMLSFIRGPRAISHQRGRYENAKIYKIRQPAFQT